MISIKIGEFSSYGGALHMTLSLVNDKYYMSKTFRIIMMSPYWTGDSTTGFAGYICLMNQKSLSSLPGNDVISL